MQDVGIYFQTFYMELMNLTDPAQKKAGVRYMKKAFLKVDMTPMVDLGFLLITFFVFTTEVLKPRETLLIMPSDGIDSTNIENEKVLTAILGNNNKIFVYHGNWEEAFRSGAIYKTGYSTRDGLGKIIRQKLISLAQRFGPDSQKEFMLLIKPSESSTYQNVIDAFDEVLINNVKKYAITELLSDEKIYVKEN